MSEMNASSTTSNDLSHASREAAGTMLQRERERQGLSLDEVAVQLNLRPTVVSGIEEDHFEQVPIAAYRRGYVRAYARLLAMDENAVVHAYDAQHGRADIDRKLSPMSSTRAPSRVGAWIFRLFTLLVIVGLIALTLLWWQSREGNDIFGGGDDPVAVDTLENGSATSSTESASNDTAMTPNTDTQLPPAASQRDLPAGDADTATALEGDDGLEASTPPDSSELRAESIATTAGDTGITADDATDSDAATDAATPASVDDNTLTLTFNEASWTEIYDANDDRIFSGLQPADSQATAEGTPPFRLTIGNASGVALEYRGEPVELGQHTGGNNVARFTLGD
ncbi:RodZ domain-containing protein [Salinicola avicenniae]|uniref:RodZ domain-containing protein n=1 Tax=Salinicola avicenniae TaxID=2916836 RepID=UPI0020734402|nr:MULTISPECIES: RodZ domain-containing protein [unclassified Salinicola]